MVFFEWSREIWLAAPPKPRQTGLKSRQSLGIVGQRGVHGPVGVLPDAAAIWERRMSFSQSRKPDSCRQ